MAYTGDGQTQRVQAGGASFRHSLLGLSSEAAGGATTYYTRDNRGNLAGQRLPGGGRSYYLFDGLGSTAAVTDASGGVVATYQYDPDGKQTGATGTLANPWRFGGAYGGYSDAQTGLVKLGTRHYAPALGRWTQQDPRPQPSDSELFRPHASSRLSYSALAALANER